VTRGPAAGFQISDTSGPEVTRFQNNRRIWA